MHLGLWVFVCVVGSGGSGIRYGFRSGLHFPVVISVALHAQQPSGREKNLIKEYVFVQVRALDRKAIAA